MKTPFGDEADSDKKRKKKKHLEAQKKYLQILKINNIKLRRHQTTLYTSRYIMYIIIRI